MKLYAVCFFLDGRFYRGCADYASSLAVEAESDSFVLPIVRMHFPIASDIRYSRYPEYADTKQRLLDRGVPILTMGDNPMPSDAQTIYRCRFVESREETEPVAFNIAASSPDEAWQVVLSRYPSAHGRYISRSQSGFVNWPAGLPEQTQRCYSCEAEIVGKKWITLVIQAGNALAAKERFVLEHPTVSVDTIHCSRMTLGSQAELFADDQTRDKMKLHGVMFTIRGENRYRIVKAVNRDSAMAKVFERWPGAASVYSGSVSSLPEFSPELEPIESVTADDRLAYWLVGRNDGGNWSCNEYCYVIAATTEQVRSFIVREFPGERISDIEPVGTIEDSSLEVFDVNDTASSDRWIVSIDAEPDCKKGLRIYLGDHCKFAGGPRRTKSRHHAKRHRSEKAANRWKASVLVRAGIDISAVRIEKYRPVGVKEEPVLASVSVEDMPF